MRTYVITTTADYGETVVETYFYRSAADDNEVRKRFGELFRILKKENISLNSFSIIGFNQLPFFINDRAIHVENFWPISFAG